MSADSQSISVVVPVFREAGSLRELHARLDSSLTGLTNRYEVIFVDDGGEDGSWEIIVDLARSHEQVKGIRFTRNFGQHNAISAGLKNASGDWIVVMDADLQDPPEAIPALLKKCHEGFHVVAAIRANRADTRLRRFLSARFSKVFSFLTGMPYDTRIGVFRIISRRAANGYNALPEKLRFFAGILAWLGFPTATVEVENAERFAGKSNYNLFNLLALAVSVMIAYSDRPLRFTVYAGFFIAFVSFLLGGYIFGLAWLYDRSVQGWASLIVSLYFIGGLVIGTIGIVGLYLGRVFEAVKNRPDYMVLDQLNMDHDSSRGLPLGVPTVTFRDPSGPVMN